MHTCRSAISRTPLFLNPLYWGEQERWYLAVACTIVFIYFLHISAELLPRITVTTFSDVSSRFWYAAAAGADANAFYAATATANADEPASDGSDATTTTSAATTAAFYGTSAAAADGNAAATQWTADGHAATATADSPAAADAAAATSAADGTARNACWPDSGSDFMFLRRDPSNYGAQSFKSSSFSSARFSEALLEASLNSTCKCSSLEAL